DSILDFWPRYAWLNDEGKQYEFFKGKVTGWLENTILAGMDKTQNESRPARRADEYWWERSCTPSDTTSFLGCYCNGNPLRYVNDNHANRAYGVVLGFSL
ncbi:MAG: hypothetical protein RR477_08805, partial [Raoultibacter sp.]